MSPCLHPDEVRRAATDLRCPLCMEAEIERLLAIPRDIQVADSMICELRAEIERLQALHENAKHWEAQWLAENERLRTALKPFAVVDQMSLIDTLGHITREDIASARRALEGEQEKRG